MTSDPRFDVPLTLTRAGCPSCREVFSTVRNFDAHRPKGVCVPPGTVGLAKNSHGVWRIPREDQDGEG